ncbi:hypothetical protein CDAR_272861 [Caerostris darwini]|uniref:Uncharacterized protein n=1 Tax=Caerostris darwini TaxID=1538125 RepID=A0AAV4MI88_9ARAC|nr:hypothetical protein CDAR_272861 [Caerostris darwini]
MNEVIYIENITVVSPRNRLQVTEKWLFLERERDKRLLLDTMLNTRRSLAKDFIVWGRWKWNSPLCQKINMLLDAGDRGRTDRWKGAEDTHLGRKGGRAKKMDGFLKSNPRRAATKWKTHF